MNAEQRDAMVQRVADAFAEHPTFYDWPILDTPGDLAQPVPGQQPFEQRDYVTALYELCARGVPTGRMGNTLIGSTVA